MSFVVVAAAFGLARAHRQQRLGPIQRLNLRLFIDAQNQRAIRWIQIEPDDVAHFVDEQRILGELESLAAGLSISITFLARG